MCILLSSEHYAIIAYYRRVLDLITDAKKTRHLHHVCDNSTSETRISRLWYVHMKLAARYMLPALSESASNISHERVIKSFEISLVISLCRTLLEDHLARQITFLTLFYYQCFVYNDVLVFWSDVNFQVVEKVAALFISILDSFCRWVDLFGQFCHPSVVTLHQLELQKWLWRWLCIFQEFTLILFWFAVPPWCRQWYDLFLGRSFFIQLLSSQFQPWVFMRFNVLTPEPLCSIRYCARSTPVSL